MSYREAQEALEDGATQVNNLVHSFRLQSTSFDKKSYLTYLKSYMKAVKAELQKTNPERVATFEKNAGAFAKKIIANFNDYEFYTGASCYHFCKQESNSACTDRAYCRRDYESRWDGGPPQLP